MKFQYKNRVLGVTIVEPLRAGLSTSNGVLGFTAPDLPESNSGGRVAKFLPQLPRVYRARSWRGPRASRAGVVQNLKFGVAGVRDRALQPRFAWDGAVTVRARLEI